MLMLKMNNLTNFQNERLRPEETNTPNYKESLHMQRSFSSFILSWVSLNPLGRE